MQGGPQQIQDKIAADGQPVPGQIIHPGGPQQNGGRQKFQHPVFGFQFVAAIDVGRVQGKIFFKGAGVLQTGVYLIGTECHQLGVDLPGGLGNP